MSPWVPDEHDKFGASLAFCLYLDPIVEHNEVERLALGAGKLIPIRHERNDVGSG